MTGSAMQEPVLVSAFGFVLGADRIIRAKLSEFQGIVNMLLDS